jgi:hypothetical protein
VAGRALLSSLPKFAQMLDRMTLEEALEAHPEYRALRDAPDSSRARLCFFNALARRHLETVHREVLKFGRAKGIGLEDPVFAAAAAAEDSLRALAAEDNATLVHYFDVRLALLDHVPHANPRFAKLAFGRGAMWPLIEEAWTELCEWTVYFVRRLQLARQPDLALTFLMLNSGKKASLHCETSPHDDDLATKLPVPKGAERTRDVLPPAHGDDAAAHALWERLRTEAPTRRLGSANALVACTLLLGSPLSRASPQPPSSSRPPAGSRGLTAACPERAACSTLRACPLAPRRSRRFTRGSRRSRRASPSARRRPRMGHTLLQQSQQ